MPISSLVDISLASVFQDLPYLVASHGLYADVSGYGSPTKEYVGTVMLKVCTYDKDGLLKESRLLNKMNHLPPCSLPCNYCSEASSEGEDRCPLCLRVCKPTWTKKIYSVKMNVTATGEIIIDELGEIGNTLYSFLAPRILKLVNTYEETHEYTEQVFADAQKKKEDNKNLRRRNTDESP
jgi:hypothetical protein